MEKFDRESTKNVPNIIYTENANFTTFNILGYPNAYEMHI